jgi:squalene-hopene/tetraprenyl-beta-curcumene cyclase
MLARFEESDGLGAIFPPIIWSILALRCLDHDDQSPPVRECHRQLEALILEDDEMGTVRLQPCKSPVWDTAIALRALAESSVRPDSSAIGRGVRWLLERQTRRPGDWAETVRAEPGGWFFEYHNEFYPDSDDTAMVLLALRACFDEAPPHCAALPPELRPVHGDCPDFRGEVRENGTVPLGGERLSRRTNAEEHIGTMRKAAGAIDRGLEWLLAMQNRDGGWGAFDRNNDREFLCYVPFADHNAMIDPSTPDLAGRVLEALGRLGYQLGHPAVDRAVDYVRRNQEPDGSWFGRWGVNYVYGTWQALTGLAEAGVPRDDPAVAAGAGWLLAHQQACGGWGESPDSYEDPSLRGRGTPTASQTAWAILGLLAAGMHEHPAVSRAVRFLTHTQNEDGTWDEPEFTGTGFPRVFYLRYHYYRIYFPLLALARWAVNVQPLLSRDLETTLRLRTG